jgi:ADP-heptose:LPS heptosyltransferase
MPENQVLIIHQGALGDFVVTFPILTALRTTIPCIDGICRSSFGRLAVDLGVLDASYPLESARFASLYAERIDPEMVTLMSTYRSILLFSFSEPLERSVKNINGLRVFRILPWPAVTQKIHITEFLARQVRNCDLLDKEAGRRFARALFHLKGEANRNCRAGKRAIISPGAGSMKKRWPLERFMMVAAELKKRGLQPSIILGPAEVDLEAALHHIPQPQLQVVNTRSFQELITVLESAVIYIGNDSGVSHLAAFLGVPTLVIFGPSDPDRWRPFGDHVRIVKPASPCSPCFDTGTPDCMERTCLEDINPERIVGALEDMFDTERKAGK